MVAGTGVLSVAAVIDHNGCAQASGVMVEACRNAHVTGSRNRMMIVVGRARDIFLLFIIVFAAQANVSSDVIRANRLQAQGVLEPNGIGERTTNNSKA